MYCLFQQQDLTGAFIFGGALYIIIAMLIEWPDKRTKTTAEVFIV